MYVGWPTRVNKSVLDSTNVSVGEGAAKEETLENGKKRSRLALTNPPKRYSVTMRFNYSEKDEKGLSEKDRFWNWYERVLKYSTNEFQFPDLMFGINTEKLCWYRITGAVQGAKSGLDQEVQMTWETSYEGVITFEPDPAVVSDMEGVNGAITVLYTATPQVSPTTNDFGALMLSKNVGGTYQERTVPITGIRYFDNDRCYLYFDKVEAGNYVFYFTNYPNIRRAFRA